MSEESFKILPEDMNVASNLAYWLSIRERNLERADRLSNLAVTAVPEHPLYWWTRGLVLEKREEYRKALDALKKAATALGNIENGAAYMTELNGDIERVRRLVRGKI